MDLKLPKEQAHGLNHYLWTALYEAFRELHSCHNDDEWKGRLRSRMGVNFSEAGVASLLDQSETRGTQGPITEKTIQFGKSAFETALEAADLQHTPEATLP